jgi:hypothetical protein
MQFLMAAELDRLVNLRDMLPLRRPNELRWHDVLACRRPHQRVDGDIAGRFLGNRAQDPSR